MLRIPTHASLGTIKVRWLFLWCVASVLLYMLVTGILPILIAFDGVTQGNIFTVYLYLSIGGWILWRGRKETASLRRVWQDVRARWSWKYAFGMLPLIVFCAVASIFMLSLLEIAFPAIGVDAPLVFFNSASTPYPILNTVVSILLLVVLAPVVEELVFRGVMLNRWARRGEMRSALIASSLLFGLLHLDILGHTAFGLLFGLVYLRTRNILAPIFLHAFNNALVSLLVLPELWSPVTGPATRDELVGVTVMTGILTVLLSPVFYRFLSNHWQHAQEPLR